MSLEKQKDNKKFEYVINDINSVTKVLDIKVSKENFDKTYQNILNDTASKVKINGFRPGKAPKQMIESMYQTAIFADTKDKLVRESISNCIKDKNLELYSVKSVDFSDEVLDDNNSQNDVSFKVTVEVYPTIPSVPNYDGVKVIAEKEEYTDDLLNKSLDTLAKQFSTPTLVTDRKPKEGDNIKFSLEVSYEDGTKEEKREYYRLLNDSSWNMENSASFDKVIKDSLYDMNVGDTKECKSTIKIVNQKGEFEPGKVTYNFSLDLIEESKTPELTDDFVKNLPGYGVSSIDELKEQLSVMLKSQIEASNHERVKDAVVRELLKSFDFDIPEAMIVQEVQKILSSQANGYIRDIDLSKVNNDVREHIIRAYSPIAKQRIQVMYLIDAVVKNENIQVSNEEYKEFLAEIEAKEGPLPKKVDRNRLKQAITLELQRTKAWDLLCEKANVSFVGLGELKEDSKDAASTSEQKPSKKSTKKEAKSDVTKNDDDNASSEAPKKTRAKKASATKDVASSESDDAKATDEAPKAKRGRKKKEEA